MYYLKTDYDLDDFVIQKEELTELKWFSMQELETMVENKILNPNQIACFKSALNI
jgi:NADH pyrophosphatase NudC (nudix superfamily)